MTSIPGWAASGVGDDGIVGSSFTGVDWARIRRARRTRMITVMEQFFGDLGTLMNRGGYVMIPLLLLSICSVTLIIERAVFWLTVNGRASLRRLSEMNAALRRGQNDRVQELIKVDRTPYGRVAQRLIKDGAGDAVSLEAVDGERRKFNRFMERNHDGS